MLLGKINDQRKTRDRIQITNSRSKKDITTDPKDIKNKGYYEQLYVNKFGNSRENRKFLEKHNYKNW